MLFRSPTGCARRWLDGSHLSLPYPAIPSGSDFPDPPPPVKADRHRWMEQIWRRWSRSESSCTCPLFCLSRSEFPIQWTSPDWRTRYLSPSRTRVETMKFDRCATTQLALASVQCLWIYDYFLTLRDEVRYPYFSRQRYQVLTVAKIRYVWSGRRSWGKFTSASSKLR